MSLVSASGHRVMLFLGMAHPNIRPDPMPGIRQGREWVMNKHIKRMYKVKRIVKYTWTTSATSALEAEEIAEQEWAFCEEERGEQEIGKISVSRLPLTYDNYIDATVSYCGELEL